MAPLTVLSVIYLVSSLDTDLGYQTAYCLVRQMVDWLGSSLVYYLEEYSVSLSDYWMEYLMELLSVSRMVIHLASSLDTDLGYKTA